MGPRGRDTRRVAALAATSAALLTLTACGRSAPPPHAARPGDAGFLPPPTLVGAERRGDGGLHLVGHAPPDAIVRILSPDGRALGATADASGAWGADLPPAATPEMFALSAEVAGRTLRAEGALAVAPPDASAAALIARAGAPSAPVGGATPASVRIQTVDFDQGGGLAAAGRAPAGATLRLVIDGAAAGSGKADAQGRFGLLFVGLHPLAPGAHRVRVEAQNGAVDEAEVETTRPAPLAGTPYRAAHVAGGWRLDWSPPGGGVQSLLLTAAGAR